VTPPEAGPPDPGQHRLDAYLEELRADPPAADTALVRRVSRSARWQQTLRGPLQLAAHLGGALFDGIGTMLGDLRRRHR
jgi:hypothetical protein